jgi:L-fucose isomerase-like protein
MEPYRIAFLPLARTTFDIPLAEEVTRQAHQALRSAGFDLYEAGKLITDLDTAQTIGRELSAEPVDLALVFQATFADSTMVTTLAEAIDAPLFLWAIPEAFSGGRLRLNSLCGINLAGHALTLRNRDYAYAYAPSKDPETIGQIRSLAAAGRLRRQLHSARLGVVGEHPAGMDSCHLDAPLLEARLGVQIRRISLEEVFARARQIPQDRLADVRTALDARLDKLAELDQKPLAGSLSVYQALKEIALQEKLDGLAVRCWPEFFTELSCAACGAMSLLSDGFNGQSPIPCSCEADINGTVTQLILQWLASADAQKEHPAFGTDIVAMDFEKDQIAIWHCGLAPLSMADPTVQPRGGIHSNRRVPLVMEFPLKPGQVTIARLSQATGELRLVLGLGEMIQSPPPFSGTSGVLRLEIPARQFFDQLLQQGLEHHISLVYGNYLASLAAFANLVNLPVLRLSSLPD